MKYSVVVSNVSLVVAVAAFVLAEGFIGLWMPENFPDPHGASLVFAILLVGLVPHLMTNVSINALEAVNKHKYYAYQTILEGVANLGLSVVLVKKFGIYGVALGTAIPSLVAKIIIQPLYCVRIFGLGWWPYMWRVILKPGCVALPLAILFAATGFLQAVTFRGLICNGIIIVAIHSTLAYWLCLDAETCQILRQKGQRLFGILKPTKA